MKKCICIKKWRDYNINDVATYLIGSKGTWFLGGCVIDQLEFKEHFQPLKK